MAARTFRDGASREAFWREHVARWASSGQSIAGYCRARDLSEGCFHYWKSARNRREARRAADAARPAFAEVQVAVSSTAPIEIAFDGGCRVQVRPGFDEETLARVLAVMERGAC